MKALDPRQPSRLAGPLAGMAAHPNWSNRAAGILALASVYFLTARLGLLFAIPGGHVTPVWPPSGIALAAMLLLDRRLWPGIWLGSFAANLWDFYGSPLSLFAEVGTSAVFGAGASLTALIGAWLLRQAVGERSPLERVRDVCAFMALGGVVSCLLSATIGVTTLCLAGFAPWSGYGQVWLTWWLGDMAGVFVLTPLLLVWSTRWHFRQSGISSAATWRPGWLETIICFGLLIRVTYYIFIENTTYLFRGEPLTFVLIPFLVWPAVRFGSRGAASAGALIAVLAVWGTIHGSGPFNFGPRNESLLLLEIFLGVVVLTALCMAAIVAERQYAEAEQQKVLDDLERRVQSRTSELLKANLDLTTEIAERQRAEEQAARLLAEAERARGVLLSLLEDQQLAEDRQRQLGARVARAQHVAHLGFIDWDLRTNDIYLSDEVCRLYGLDRASTTSASELIANSIHPEDAKRVEEALKLAIQGEPYDIDHRIVQPDGEVLWMHAQAQLLRDTDGQPLTLLGTVLDITERKKAEQALVESEEKFATIFKVAPGSIMLSSQPDGKTVEVNDNFSVITGYSRAEALGKTPEELGMWADPFARDRFYSVLQADGMVQDFEADLNHKSGAVRSGLVSGHLVMVRAKKYILGTFQDITERKANQRELEDANRELARSNAELEHIAHYDVLTGLPNRALVADRLQQAMAHGLRRNRLVAVAFLDLDGFKEVNDQNGHAVGDELLICVAERMKAAMRDGDTLARIGGDEFVAVMADLEQERDCEPILARLLQAAAEPVTAGDNVLHVSVSIGVTLYPLDGADADQLMRHADQAMYLAKQAGKNCYHLFDVVLDSAVKTQRESLVRVRRALDRQEFVLYYQPKVNMRTGEVIGAEALIRWQHPERGLLPPAAFLSIIEDDPLSVTLGEWVIDAALGQMAKWQASGQYIAISVNVGALQLQQDGFVSRISALLAAHPAVMPGQLELEILETSALQDIAQVSAIMLACRELGVHFALDDFGTGYSSLTYLKRLPAEVLKIDQSFVRNMLDDPDDKAIVEGVIGLAAAFGRTAVAEGVETIAHGQALLRLGCELAQGYAIARPMPATELPNWLANWRPDASWTA